MSVRVPSSALTSELIAGADAGVPMRVVAVEGGPGLALCVPADGAGPAADVETTLVDPVAPGDRVLVHAGVALVRLDDAPPPRAARARRPRRGAAA